MTNNNKVYLLLAVLSCLHNTIMSNIIQPSLENSRNLFAMELFQAISDNEAASNENVIISPVSIQSCLTLAYMGAEGLTAEELHNGLKLGTSDKKQVAKNYGDFIKSTFKSITQNGTELHMANRVYVNENLQIAREFQQMAEEYFQSQAESVNFDDVSNAVATINNWVEQQTHNKIKNILSAESVDGDTSAVMVNAIYFKGKWVQQFSESSTRTSTFHISDEQNVNVDMMYQDDYFNYGELPELDATALEMPYENSTLSMLIILPRKVDGLKELESQLGDYDLNQLTDKMSGQHVDVFLPKFRIEYDLDLQEPLQKLGISNMFSSQANFNGLFKGSHPKQRGAEIKHKAFLDVNEAGSEASAATYLKIVPMSLNLNQKIFRADHPFFFAIRSKSAVYFAGHVVKF